MQNLQSKFRLLLSEEEIQSGINKIATILNKKFASKKVIIIALMKGSICFTADLIRKLSFSFSLELLACQSYGMRGKERGKLTMESLPINVRDAHIILLDDMFDSGNTLFTVYKEIMSQGAAYCTSIVLLMKDIDRKITYRPDLALFTIENEFVIGYGLDWKEEYRGLPGIYIHDQ